MNHYLPARPVRRLATAVGATVLAVVTVLAALPAGAAVGTTEDTAPPPPGPLADEPAVVRALAGQALGAFKYSFAVVAADPDAEYARGSVEEALRRTVLAAPAEKQGQYRTIARGLVDAPAQRRVETFDEVGRLPAEEYRRLGFAGAMRAAPVDREALDLHVHGLADQLGVEAAQIDQMLKAYALEHDIKLQFETIKTLSLYVEKVTCVDETNPEWPGDDEILMGGLKIDPKGNVSVVGQFMVKDDFDDGESKNYGNPGKAFTTYDVSTPGDFPRDYVNVVVIAEEDWSGFSDALNMAWALAAPVVKGAIEAAVTGVLAAYVGEAIANIMGKVVAWLVGAFAEFIVSLFADDVFAPGTAWVRLPHKLAFAYDDPALLGWTNKRLPTGTFTFNGHGGSYQVNVHWQVAT